MDALEQNRAKIHAWESAGQPAATHAQLSAARAESGSKSARTRDGWIEIRDRFGSWVRWSPVALQTAPA